MKSHRRRFRSLYEKVEQACREAVRRGDLGRAEQLSRRASAVAWPSGESGLRHRATINRAMVLLEVGRVDEAERGLRQVVLASSDRLLVCRAAYYLASSLRRQGRLERALFFARQARQHARAAGDAALVARCLNLLGNIHLAAGSLRRARAAYVAAVSRWRSLPGDHRFSLAIGLDNLGYCQALMGKLGAGISLIQEALGLTLETGDRRTEAECRQDLAHSYLLLRRVPTGRVQAEAALVLAEEHVYLDITRNCLYLLGEMAALEGQYHERDAYFARLQSTFPDFPYLSRLLRFFDLSRVLTLHS